MPAPMPVPARPLAQAQKPLCNDLRNRVHTHRPASRFMTSEQRERSIAETQPTNQGVFVEEASNLFAEELERRTQCGLQLGVSGLERERHAAAGVGAPVPGIAVVQCADRRPARACQGSRPCRWSRLLHRTLIAAVEDVDGGHFHAAGPARTRKAGRALSGTPDASRGREAGPATADPGATTPASTAAGSQRAMCGCRAHQTFESRQIRM